MSLIKIAQKAKHEGLRPIDCPEVMEALAADAMGTLAIICDIWSISTDKYHKQEQSAKYARRYPFYPGKKYGL